MSFTTELISKSAKRFGGLCMSIETLEEGVSKTLNYLHKSKINELLNIIIKK